MKQRKREFTGTPEDFGKLDQVQESAIQLVKQHLAQPVREMEAKGCNALEVASALIMLGYHVLRQNRSEKAAVDAFDALAHFGRRRLETGRKRYMTFRASKLN